MRIFMSIAEFPLSLFMRRKPARKIFIHTVHNDGILLLYRLFIFARLQAAPDCLIFRCATLAEGRGWRNRSNKTVIIGEQILADKRGINDGHELRINGDAPIYTNRNSYI